MKIVLASHNKGKIQEVTDILAPFGIEVEPIPEDFPEIEEDGDSFEENAKIKARAVCKATGLPAVGDDTGLVIDALDGFPGIHSARWAGPNVSAHEKNQLLIEKMLPIPEDERGFGYDPIFCVPEYGCTFGELASDVKNSISHRARAFTALGSALKQYAEEGE